MTYAGNLLAISVTNQSTPNYRPLSDTSVFAWLRGPHAIFLYGTVAGMLLVMAIYRWDAVRFDWGEALTVDAWNHVPPTAEPKPTEDVEALRSAHEILNTEHFAFIDYFKESPGSFVTLLERRRTGEDRSDAEKQKGPPQSILPLVQEIFPTRKTEATKPTENANISEPTPQPRFIMTITFSEAALTKVADQQAGSQ